MKEKIQMEIRNINAAGIDVGSKCHYVAVCQNLDDFKDFGVYHSDHEAIVLFLRERNIKTIAMESTGSYWQSLYLVLVENGFEVLLVPGAKLKVLGRPM